MAEYNHVLMLSPETAEMVSDNLVGRAGEKGVGLIISGEGGLVPLSAGIAQQELERLARVLPKGTAAAKANGILHKLEYRLKASGKEKSAVLEKDGNSLSY